MRLTEILLAQFPEPPPFVEAKVALEFLRNLFPDQPKRVLHIEGVVKHCRELSRDLGATPDWASQLEQIALYHDIGYALPLRRTGFHPLDGAILMAHQGLPDECIHAVLHHSGAREGAKYVAGAAEFYAQLPAYEPTSLSDAITFGDIHTSPLGERVSITERVEEVANRYGEASQTTIVMRRLQPEFTEIFQRVLQAQIMGLNPGLTRNASLDRSP
jgi:hypothetical protein